MCSVLCFCFFVFSSFHSYLLFLSFVCADNHIILATSEMRSFVRSFYNPSAESANWSSLADHPRVICSFSVTSVVSSQISTIEFSSCPFAPIRLNLNALCDVAVPPDQVNRLYSTAGFTDITAVRSVVGGSALPGVALAGPGDALAVFLVGILDLLKVSPL